MELHDRDIQGALSPTVQLESHKFSEDGVDDGERMRFGAIGLIPHGELHVHLSGTQVHHTTLMLIALQLDVLLVNITIIISESVTNQNI